MVTEALGIDGNRVPENIRIALEIQNSRGGDGEKYSGQVVSAKGLNVDVVIALHLDFNKIFKKSLPNPLMRPNICNMGHTGGGVEDADAVRGGKVELLRKSGREVEIA